jgi:hypothetical protein
VHLLKPALCGVIQHCLPSNSQPVTGYRLFSFFFQEQLVYYLRTFASQMRQKLLKQVIVHGQGGIADAHTLRGYDLTQVVYGTRSTGIAYIKFRRSRGMLRLTKGLFTGTLLSALLLSGCGNKAQEETIPVASPDGVEATAVHSFTGKISSISGNEITLYKAKSGGIQESGVAEPDPAGEAAAAGSNAGDDNGGEAQTAETGNTAAGGNDTAGSEAAVEENGSAANADAAGNNASGGPSSPALEFTEETVVITVDDETEYVIQSGTAEAGTSTDAAAGDLTLADLQAGDIITVTLTGDTLIASMIELQNGLIAGGGSLTAAPDAGASPGPQPSPETPGASADGQAAPPQDGKAGERPAGGKDGGPTGDAPAGAGGGAAGGAPSGAPDKQGAAASAKPAATPAADAKPAASTSPAASASAGASSKPAASAKPAAADGGGNGGMAPGAAMSFGKIKSISGSKITLYTAEVPSAAPQDGAAPAGGAQGAEPSGRPSGEPGAAGGGEGGGPQGQGGGQMSFSEETTVITVASDTKLITVTFTDGKRTETTIALSTLKADDIIQYTLKSGTTEAESISLSSGK